MATLWQEVQELKDFYQRAGYRELIDKARSLMECRGSSFTNLGGHEDAEISVVVGWAYHQLGDYAESMKVFRAILDFSDNVYVKDGDIESAERGLAHGLLQTGGDLAEVDKLMKEIPPSLELDNVYMNAALKAAQAGKLVRADIILGRIRAALETVPYKTVNGHIVNNGTMALHWARGQEAVKPYAPILPGLMGAAFGIYEATDAAKNHLAGCLFRTSQIIMETAGRLDGSLTTIRRSIAFWKDLVASQGGERYQKNLDGALAQEKKVLDLLSQKEVQENLR